MPCWKAVFTDNRLAASHSSRRRLHTLPRTQCASLCCVFTTLCSCAQRVHVDSCNSASLLSAQQGVNFRKHVLLIFTLLFLLIVYYIRVFSSTFFAQRRKRGRNQRKIKNSLFFPPLFFTEGNCYVIFSMRIYFTYEATSIRKSIT